MDSELEPITAPPSPVDLPEEQPVLGEERWRAIANRLFELLDDIDTAGDMAKGDDQVYRTLVQRIHGKRFEVGKTDGYRVVFA